MDTLQPIINLLPEEMREYGMFILAGVGLLLLAVLLLLLKSLVRSLFRGRAQKRDPQRDLLENLASYPPPFAKPGPNRLTVQGVPVRVRLVVVASAGKTVTLDEKWVEPMLDQLIRGLGAILKHDQPRVRVWPAQLSSKGFTVNFHRLTKKPEEESEPSRWVMVAGQTPARPRSFLLGLALWADEETNLGRLTLEPDQWTDLLRVKTLEN